MKKAAGFLLSLLIISGCATVGQFFGEPDLKIQGVTIEGIDLEGITFCANYLVTNPYPVGVEIDRIVADVGCDGNDVVSIVADEGVNLAASKSNNNSVLFKLPYASIIELAGNSRGRESLPFVLDGIVSFDLSSVPYIDNQKLNIPFHYDFDVPVFSPQIRVSGGKVLLPSVREVTKALVTGGLNIIKAGVIAGKFITGQPVDSEVFEGVDLDIRILFDIEVDNQGGAPWVFDLHQCRIDTGLNSLVEMKLNGGLSQIEGSDEPLHVTAVVNTLEWGVFIASLVGGDVKNAELVLDGALSFPGLDYAPELPFNLKQSLSLGAFKLSSD